MRPRAARGPAGLTYGWLGSWLCRSPSARLRRARISARFSTRDCSTSTPRSRAAGPSLPGPRPARREFVFAIEVLVCPRCAGPRRIVGAGHRAACRAAAPRGARLCRRAAAGPPRPRRLTRGRSRPATGAAVPVCAPGRGAGFGTPAPSSRCPCPLVRRAVTVRARRRRGEREARGRGRGPSNVASPSYVLQARTRAAGGV
jgi:hypothetical protein